MKYEWSYNKTVQQSIDRYCNGRFRAEEENAFWEELQSGDTSLSFIGSIPSITVGLCLVDEIVIESGKTPVIAKEKLHQWWRYEALNLRALIHALDSAVTKENKLSNALGTPPAIGSQDLNRILMLAALSAVMGEDRAASFFTRWCIYAIEQKRPVIRQDASVMADVELFLLYFLAELVGLPSTHFRPFHSPFNRIVEAHARGGFSPQSTLELVELHLAKIGTATAEDDDFNFGLQVGVASLMPLEIQLALQVTDTSLDRSDVLEHPFLDSPLARLCSMPNVSLPDEFYEATLHRCKVLSPGFSMCW